MTAATPRTASTGPELRQLLAAVGALILAVALLVAVTVSRQASSQTGSSPAGVATSGGHDHGWSSSTEGSKSLVVRDLIVTGSDGGAIRYTGIPYPAPEHKGTGGANGTRFPQ